MNQIAQFPALRDALAPSLRASLAKAFASEEAAYRAGRWLQGVAGNDKAAAWARENGVTSKAHSEGINSAGGFFVPNELASAVIRLRENYGVFRRNATVVPMASELASISRTSVPVTAAFVGEGVAVTATQATITNVNLLANKASTLIIASSELADDALAFAEWAAEELAYAFAKLEDDAAFNGDGLPAYGGIKGIRSVFADGLGALAGAYDLASGHDTFAEIDAADINGLISKLPGYALPGARWYVSPVGFALTFCRLATSYGGLVSRNINGRNELMFAGFPVEISASMPTVTTDISDTSMILFGDMRLAGVLGDRRQLRIEMSTEHKFAEDQIAIKATERFDIAVHGYGDNTTPGPIIAAMGE